MKKYIIRTLLLVITMLGLFTLIIVLLLNGFIRFNNPSLTDYPIQGIDVSNHQKIINWDKLNKERVQFAFIKATEGGDFKDKSFIQNWTNAKKENIVVGAYHFFTFCRSPEDQAQNFIESVPNEQGMLPPAIDLEYSGNCKLTKTKADLLCDIETFIEIIENHYKRKMIIYVTIDFYKDVLIGKFTDNYFWLRNIYTKPDDFNNVIWDFWQFSDRGRFDGIETLVDMNTFNGNKNDFNALLKTRIK